VTVGVDIGQKHDPTALVVVEAVERPTGRVRRTGGGEAAAPETEAAFEARFLERLPLGTAYPDVAARVAAVARGVLDRSGADPRAPGRRVTLVLDATGVGQPIADLLRAAVKDLPVRVTAATFTHGDRLSGRPGARELTVGKAFLVSRLQALLQTGRLALPAGHPEAAALAQELLDYEIRVDPDGDAKFGAFRTGRHDDLVTALGLAVLTEPYRGVLLTT